MSGKTIIARRRPDGTIVQVLEDGTERPFPPSPPVPEMTDEEVEAAALSDPDNPPLTDEDFARMKRTPQVKIIRRALGLTQEEFAERYYVPVDTLQDWEQRRSGADQTARAYLQVIAVGQEIVQQLLRVEPKRA